MLKTIIYYLYCGQNSIELWWTETSCCVNTKFCLDSRWLCVTFEELGLEVTREKVELVGILPKAWIPSYVRIYYRTSS